ncbi:MULTISPECIES: hypothetical protein [unclassified Micromonospora]|uniref:hypothetical protein n=1 Tax=unclassified Micromonospora TaxID=2617518 RepID=UPI002416287C|nr:MULTISPECIES: hypothetical protein [unclassified Micromonospora]MDG4816550.1 hypothetical protein [Micromonospora sp. WMMD956]WFE59034.1 hypothetical protein O7633_20280 [Micromonospora sp. WMMD712]
MIEPTLIALAIAGIATKLSALHSELAHNFALHMPETETVLVYSSFWYKWVASTGAHVMDLLINSMTF